MLPDGRSHTRWTIWAGFAALCVLVSNSWLLPTVPDDGASSIVRQSCLDGVLGMVALVATSPRLWVRLRESSLVLPRLAGVSVMLLGVPAVASAWARGGVPDVSQAALFALVPFIVVVVAMGREPGAGEEFAVRRFFAPALAGFGGVLLLLSFNFPVSARGRTMFGVLLLAVVVTGVASAWIYRLLGGFTLMEAFAVVCLSNAVFLAVCSLLLGASWSRAWPLISISSLYYLLELVLLVWLLRAMSPVRLAARYLVVPLLAVLEGLAILRPDFTVRMGAGLVLLAGGAGYILFSRRQNSDAALSVVG
ncbi:MAG: hypothetical protein ABI158_13515 [Edaphobacter sp.]